jgi:putative peptidoglycan lipid II flippase
LGQASIDRMGNRAGEKTTMSSTTDSHHNLAEKVVKASLSVGAAHVLFRLSGLILSLTAAACFGKEEYEAVFTVAFGMVWYLFLTGEELIGPAFLPVFMKAKDAEGEKAAWDFTNALLTLQSLILFAVILVVICFPDFFIQQILDQDKWNDTQARYTLLRQSLLIMIPALFFFSLGSTTYMLLNGYKKFFLAALGDAAWKFTAIGAALAGTLLLGGGIKALCFGVLVGSSVKIATHLTGLRGRLTWFRPNFRWNNPHLKAFLLLVAPLIVGILFAKFRDVYNNLYLPSHLQSGMLQARDLSTKLGSTLAMIVPFTLQIALFPFLCELVDRDDKKKLGEVLTHSSRMLLSVFTPLAVALAAAAAPLAFLIFYRGKMDFDVTCWVGLGMSVYLFVLPAMALENILMQGCFANRKMVAMTVLGITCSILSMLGGWIFIVQMDWSGIRALVVIIGSFVASRWIKSALLILVMKRALPIFAWRETTSFVLRLGTVSVLLWLAVHFADRGTVRVLGDGIATAQRQIDKAVLDPTLSPSATATHFIAAQNLGPALASQPALAATAKFLAIPTHPPISSFIIACRVAVDAITALVVGTFLLLLLQIREPFEMAQWCLQRLPAPVKRRLGM